MDYREAKKRLGNRESRKIANNTYLERRDEKTIAIRLHSTDVVTFTPTYIELDSGGWPTMTTADRMRIAPMMVSGSRNGWAVYPLVTVDCYCCQDRDSEGIIVRGARKIGDRLEYTGHYLNADGTETECRKGDGSKPIYEWLQCWHCGGTGKRLGYDYASGGHPYYDGIRFSADGSRLLKSQPNMPDRWEPVKTESGFGGHGYGWQYGFGFAATRKRVF